MYYFPEMTQALQVFSRDVEPTHCLSPLALSYHAEGCLGE